MIDIVGHSILWAPVAASYVWHLKARHVARAFYLHARSEFNAGVSSVLESPEYVASSGAGRTEARSHHVDGYWWRQGRTYVKQAVAQYSPACSAQMPLFSNQGNEDLRSIIVRDYHLHKFVTDTQGHEFYHRYYGVAAPGSGLSFGRPLRRPLAVVA